MSAGAIIAMFSSSDARRKANKELSEKNRELEGKLYRINNIINGRSNDFNNIPSPDDIRFAKSINNKLSISNDCYKLIFSPHNDGVKLELRASFEKYNDYYFFYEYNTSNVDLIMKTYVDIVERQINEWAKIDKLRIK